MARNTLPSGASLLALAGSTTAREILIPAAPLPGSRPSVGSPRIATANLTPAKPQGQEIADGVPGGLAAARSCKQKVNARISAILLEEVRDCVVALSGPPYGLTMDQFAEEAYRRELERLQKAYAGGKSFARRPYNPRPGRRVA